MSENEPAEISESDEGEKEKTFYSVPSEEEISRVLSVHPYVLEDADHVEDEYLDLIDARLGKRPLEILRTKRCIVREIAEADLPRLYEIYSEPGITKYMEDLYEDPDEELAYIRDYIKWHYGLYGFGMWVITDPDGKVIGRAGFEQKEEEKRPELGFMIRADLQRQGLAYEVCSAILEYAGIHYDFEGTDSFCDPENEASRALLRKLGFAMAGTREGKLHWKYEFL